jgi:hypothetical protein
MKMRIIELAFASMVLGAVATGSAHAQSRPTEITIATEGAYEPWNFTTDRVSGPARFATGVAASALAFPDRADLVYLANGYHWPDPLRAA